MAPQVSRNSLPAFTGLVSAIVAASCCLVPIALIAGGIAGAGLMMTTMRYQVVTLPLGVGGLGAAYWMYARHRRHCASVGCQFVGQRATQAILGLATAVVVFAILLVIFPSWTASLLGAGSGPHTH